MAKSALCEKTLYDMVAPLEKDQVDLVFEDDGPNRLILPPSVAPEKMQDVVNKMDEALTSPGTDDERKVYRKRDNPVLTAACRSDCRSNVAGHGSVEKGP